MLKRFVLPIGVLVLLHGCAGSRTAQDLEERFSDPTPITARPVETDPTTLSVPAPEAPEADDDPPQPEKIVESDKPSAPLSSEAAVTPNLQPYRITIRLSASDPSAPAELVTRALRRANVPFAAERIESIVPSP